ATNFEGGSFDVVWAVESVCHAEDKQDFINEAFRILKPGGRLILADFFATKEQFNEEEQKLMHDWVSGWSVKALAFTPQFHQGLERAGFEGIDYQNATENVRRSAKELYQYSVLVKAGGKMLTEGRSDRQEGNVRAVHCQYPALERGLWSYGIFLAHKP
ncbi:MAG TPA: SAM-dependent methyltransferase, partial [Gammaproteobacteria bacterium]|nr:SAM-dependent methyltransferase [Gammaproteobacteria bacterium]